MRIEGAYEDNAYSASPPVPYRLTMDTPLRATLSQTLDATRRNEFWATLALRHCRDLGARTACRLLRQFGSAYAVLQALKRCPTQRASLLADPPTSADTSRQAHTASPARGAGNTAGITWPVKQQARRTPKSGEGFLFKIAETLRRGEWRIPAQQEWEHALELNSVRVILWTDNDYPARLRELPDAPALLYARGDSSLLCSPAVGVVGTRRSSERGRRDAATLAGNLAAAGLTIVSGMAVGIDRAAHKAAIALPGGTIAVLGTGIDVIYPASNADLYNELCAKGLILSEYAPGARPEPFNFPTRNRIISGLSLGVLVIEAAPRSGSLITARYALEQNRTVYAVGGNIGETGSGGCQELIRQGALPVFSHLDILRDLQPLLVHSQETEPASDLPQTAPSPAAPPQAPAPARCLSKTGTHTITASRPTSKASGHPADRDTSMPRAPEAETRTRHKPAADRNLVRLRKVSTTGSPDRKNVEAEPQPAVEGQTSGRILTELVRHGPLSVDTLCERLALPPAVVSTTLVLLEVRGHIRLRPDGRYAAV